MDFSNRGPQHDPNNNQTEYSPQSTSEINTRHPAGASTGKTKSRLNNTDWSRSKLFRAVQMVLMVCVVIVVIGLLVFLAISDSTNHSESNYIDNNRLQAVFLNTGQVYFGNINYLNNNYLILDNIFYLQTSGSSSSSSSSSSNTTVSLVKLGCEIHAPLDQMMINRASVTFWENLSNSGQVAKAVSTYEKENPDGQKCSDQSTAGTSAQTTPQNASNGSSGSSTSSTNTSGSTSTSGTK